VISRSRQTKRTLPLLATALAVFGLAASAAVAQPVPKLSRALDRAEAPSAQLDLTRTIATPGGGHIYRYGQTISGVPVIDAGVVVTDAASGRAGLAADSSAAKLGDVGEARISRASALATARRAGGIGELSTRPLARLAVAKRGGGTLVWQTELTSERPIADQQVLIDARSGKVLKETDMLKAAGSDIAARLYDTNAVMANNGYSGGIKDAGDKDSNLLTGLRVPVTLTNLTNSKGCLSGRWAEARLGRKKNKVCKSSRNFSSVKRHDDRFEALMAYFFVNRAQVYIRGLDIGEKINQRKQFVKVNAIPDDNSFYSPGDRRMTLGTGGVDDGEDGDVITHEYGHAVQDNQLPGFGGNFAGSSFGEGFGDYLAAAVSAEEAPQPAAPFRDWNSCMFEWDATSYTNNQCARRTNTTLTKTQAVNQADGDPHIVGEAWSSGLWSLRAALGDDLAGHSVMDRVVLESHFLLPDPNPTFSEGAAALLDADVQLYGGTHCGAIRTEMVNREFLSPGFPSC
jgi:hypothetical protein